MGIKLHIIYPLKNSAWGGGNQFLAALKKQLTTTDNYAENPGDADVLLFNSHHEIERVEYLKQTLKKPIIHRLDGLPQLYNNKSDSRQTTAFLANRSLADATIFQSVWSKEMHNKLGLIPSISTVIYNACDPSVFYKRPSEDKSSKFNLITTSWSDNINKGFEYLECLDKNLDFTFFNYKFVGNSPIKFKNIVNVGPMSSNGVAQLLNSSDIFITGTRNDTCSNAIIEALSCGLPVIALNSGGSPELVKDNGILFNTRDELLKAIYDLSFNISNYKIRDVVVPTITTVATQYLDLAKTLL